MLKGSLEQFGLDYMEVYLVHGPIRPQSFSQVARGLSECVDQGLTKNRRLYQPVQRKGHDRAGRRTSQI